jgi:hypothetical protein
MVTRAHNFRHADVKRAFRAAEAAGVRNPTVRVVCRDGTELHIGSAGDKAGKADAAPSAMAKPGKTRQGASSRSRPAR